VKADIEAPCGWVKHGAHNEIPRRILVFTELSKQLSAKEDLTFSKATGFAIQKLGKLKDLVLSA